jgi:hypothetical protein
MATEAQKTENTLRLAGMVLVSMAVGIWDFVGEAALVLAPKMGEEILKMLEKEMGLEVSGEKPEDILAEIGRIFVDEFGFASEITVESADNTIIVKAKDYRLVRLLKQMEAAGVEKPFICMIMNTGLAALKRLGLKSYVDVEKWEEGNGTITTFELL